MLHQVMENGENMRVSKPPEAEVNSFANQDSVDYILFIKPTESVTLNINPNEVQNAKYVSQSELKNMFQNSKLKFTPWFKLICQSMLFKWWDHLDSGLERYLNEQEIRRMLEPPKNTANEQLEDM